MCKSDQACTAHCSHRGEGGCGTVPKDPYLIILSVVRNDTKPPASRIKAVQHLAHDFPQQGLPLLLAFVEQAATVPQGSPLHTALLVGWSDVCEALGKGEFDNSSLQNVNIFTPDGYR